MSQPKKIGLVVGREWSWPPAFIEEVNKRYVVPLTQPSMVSKELENQNNFFGCVRLLDSDVNLVFR